MTRQPSGDERPALPTLTFLHAATESALAERLTALLDESAIPLRVEPVVVLPGDRFSCLANDVAITSQAARIAAPSPASATDLLLGLRTDEGPWPTWAREMQLFDQDPSDALIALCRFLHLEHLPCFPPPPPRSLRGDSDPVTLLRRLPLGAVYRLAGACLPPDTILAFLEQVPSAVLPPTARRWSADRLVRTILHQPDEDVVDEFLEWLGEQAPVLVWIEAHPPALPQRSLDDRSLDDRDLVFLAYHAEDSAWADRLKVHLQPLVRENRLQVWDVNAPLAGSLRLRELDRALDSARIAVLFLSASFFAADEIATRQLPRLLAAHTSGMLLLPLWVAPCVPDPALAPHLPMNPQSRTLSHLAGDRAAAEAVLLRVRREIDKSLL